MCEIYILISILLLNRCGTRGSALNAWITTLRSTASQEPSFLSSAAMAREATRYFRCPQVSLLPSLLLSQQSETCIFEYGSSLTADDEVR